MDWFHYAMAFLVAVLGVAIVIRFGMDAREIFFWKWRRPASKKLGDARESKRSPLWDWAPWIVVTIAGVMFVTLVIMGMDFILAICMSAGVVGGAVSFAASIYHFFRRADPPLD